ncbi:putative reverse transcriptase domain-containing protein, partial [Tanacetum coccineum]
MSSASSTVTYTSVYTDSEPGRVFWGADEEISDRGSPQVIVYEYDGLLMQPVAPPSPDYFPRPEHPPSPDYVPGLEHPPSPVEIPYIPEPDPITGYVPDSDPEEDSKEEHADYPVDRGDGDDEPSNDDSDDDTDDDDEGPFEDEEDDEEEEEHLALVDSSAIPVVDLVPSAGDTEAFETDESAPTPRSPQIKVPFSQTRLRRAWKTVRLEPPMSASMEARIAEYAVAPTPPLPVASPPLPLPSPLTTSPTDAGGLLGYMADRIRMRAAARACFATLAPGLEIGESSAAGVVRQLGPTPEADIWDKIVEAMLEVAPTTLEGVDQRVTELDTTVRQRTEEFRRGDICSYSIDWFRGEECSHRGTCQDTGGTGCHIDCSDHITSELVDCITWTYRDTRGVAAALAERDANKSIDGDNSHGSRTSGRRQVPTQRECTYTNFLKCQLMNFKGTEGVVSLTQWVEKMESVFLISNCAITSQVRVRGTDLLTYNQRFQELALMCDRMFPEESAKVERYIGGLPDMIHGTVKASKPQSMQEAIGFATEMMDKKMLTATERQAENKRKFEDTSRNNQNQQQPFKRNNVARAYTTGPGDKKPYGGTKPLCTRSDCPKLKNRNQGNRAGNGNAVAIAYVVGSAGTNPKSNVITGTFLLNNRYALILFDTGADRSFVSTTFSSLIDIIPTTLDHGYDVELADGRIIWVNTLIRGCTLNFLNHPFNIDLMLVEMGSFDVIISMDWLARYHAVIVCNEKLVRVPFGDEFLFFHGDGNNNRHESRLNIISCTKTQKYLLKGCPIFLAHITTKKAEDKSKEKRLEDVPIV